MFFDILTLFPSLFGSVFSEGIVKRAIDRRLISVSIDNIRDYSDDPHGKVDDYPYGGGPGMVMKAQPLATAIKAARKRHEGNSPKVVFLTPHGKKLDYNVVADLSKEDGLILICGRYRGIDNRIREAYVDMELSIGDYILSGGELAAMVVIDSVMRLVPGALGNSESVSSDSFYNGALGEPLYTRPVVFEGKSVPDVLLSGHHANIEAWRKIESYKVVKNNRPDLLGH